MTKRLLSCSTGEEDENGDCFASLLARELKVDVKAPTDKLYVGFDNGRVKIRIGRRDDGYMKVFPAIYS